MNTYSDKTQDEKSQSVTNAASQKQSSSTSTFQFVDNRPEVVAQRKLQEIANTYTSKNKQSIQLMNGTYSNQPLITNYLQNPTNLTFEQTNLPYHFNNEDVEIEREDSDFSATVSGLGSLGDLQLYDSGDGRKWINQIHVHSRAKRRGIGSALLQAALNQHNVIYASTQPADQDSDDDTMHLTDEGGLLVNACIGRGMNIIKIFPGME